MSGDVTRLRSSPTPVSRLQRLVDLQKAVEAEHDLMESELLEDLKAMRLRLEEAAGHLTKVGIKDQVERLAETVLGVTQRIEAIRGRP